MDYTASRRTRSAFACVTRWDYPHSESTSTQSRKILGEILAGVPEDEQAKSAGGNIARVYGFDVPRLVPR